MKNFMKNDKNNNMLVSYIETKTRKNMLSF